jgi:hypothetical protein
MERLLDVMTVFSVALALLVLVSMRRAHIRVEYSVSWLAAALLLAIVSRWEFLIRSLAALMGLNEPPLAVLFLVLTVFLIVLFRISMIISALRDNNIALAQRVAILEYRLRTIHEEREDTTKA